MNKTRMDYIHRLNYLNYEMDSIYHRSSLKFKISDSVSLVLYTIYDSGEECLLSEIYKKSGISRQTVNSAIRGLEKDDILHLRPVDGKSKKVVLTDKGRTMVKNTSARLFKAEMDAFDSWTEKEINMYLGFIEKHTECLRAMIEKL